MLTRRDGEALSNYSDKPRVGFFYTFFNVCTCTGVPSLKFNTLYVRALDLSSVGKLIFECNASANGKTFSLQGSTIFPSSPIELGTSCGSVIRILVHPGGGVTTLSGMRTLGEQYHEIILELVGSLNPYLFISDFHVDGNKTLTLVNSSTAGSVSFGPQTLNLSNSSLNSLFIVAEKAFQKVELNNVTLHSKISLRPDQISSKSLFCSNSNLGNTNDPISDGVAYYSNSGATLLSSKDHFKIFNCIIGNYYFEGIFNP